MDVRSDRSPGATTSTITRAVLGLLVVCAAVPNGLYFSPLFDPVLFMLPRSAAALFVRGADAIFYATGVLLWLMTLTVSGIPAALYERVRGLPRSSVGSLLLWLVTALLLSIPSLLAAYELISDAS